MQMLISDSSSFIYQSNIEAIKYIFLLFYTGAFSLIIFYKVKPVKSQNQLFFSKSLQSGTYEYRVQNCRKVNGI